MLRHIKTIKKKKRISKVKDKEHVITNQAKILEREKR